MVQERANDAGPTGGAGLRRIAVDTVYEPGGTLPGRLTRWLIEPRVIGYTCRRKSFPPLGLI